MPKLAILLAVLGGIPFAVNFLLPRLVAVVAVIAMAVGLLWLGYALWNSNRLLAGPTANKPLQPPSGMTAKS